MTERHDVERRENPKSISEQLGCAPNDRDAEGERHPGQVEKPALMVGECDDAYKFTFEKETVVEPGERGVPL
jgi:hypothetical protein